VGPDNHVLDRGPDPRRGKGQFFGGKGSSHCEVWVYSTVICAKTAEPIEMSSALWTRMGPRNHVLDGGPQVLRDVAMSINFWLLLGYNFGCVIATNKVFDSSGRLSGSTYPMKT